MITQKARKTIISIVIAIVSQKLFKARKRTTLQFLFPIVQNEIGWGPSFGTFAIILAFLHFSLLERLSPKQPDCLLGEIQLVLNASDPSNTVEKSFRDDESISEKTHLLGRVQSSFRNFQHSGGAMNLEEMENQLFQSKSEDPIQK